MVLEVVNGDHASGLLDKLGVQVDPVVLLLVGVADLEDVLEAVQGDLDDLVIHRFQQVAQRLDAPLRHEVPDLRRLLQPSRGRVRDRPARLLLRLEVGVLQDVDQGRDDVGVDDTLDLVWRAGSDVGDGPARLFADALLWRRQEREKGWESAGGNDDLSLEVVTSDYVAD